MLRFNSQPAYILHSRSYQETSLLLELFTQDFGRIAAIAKGAKRPKSRGRGLLQPFVPLQIACAGKGELLILKDFDAIGAPILLFGRALISAFYLNELLMRLLHRAEGHLELFQHYGKSLLSLKTASDGVAEQQILRLFEKTLLKELGYELHLGHEVDTGKPLLPEAVYLFDPALGPKTVTMRAQQTLNLSQSKDLFRGSSLIAIAAEFFTEKTVLQDAKRLMRLALKSHLGNRPLESRRLF